MTLGARIAEYTTMKRLLVLLFWSLGATAQTVAITGVNVIDTGGGPVQTGMTVTIEGDRIASIDKAPAPGAATVIDGRGKYLIPGLWDMHVHLTLATDSALPMLLANGVTGVRDLGGRLATLDRWRTKIEDGSLAGPRILRAGPTLNGQKSNDMHLVVGTPEETRGIVRALAQIEVDFIKTHRRTPRDSYFALADEAKKARLQFVGHIPITVTPEEASDAGQSTIEHVGTLFEGTFAAALDDRKLSAAIKQFRESGEAAKLVARIARNGNALTPTLVVYRSIIAEARPEAIEEAKAVFAEFQEIVKMLQAAGVTLLAGSDVAAARVPGVSLHDELELLVECGLTTLQALQTATSNPAKRLSRTSDFGAVAKGRIADLVLLDANPLDDIRNTRRIAAVIFGGKVSNYTGAP
jgi:imidazolonepropionase-like amidohydrolase